MYEAGALEIQKTVPGWPSADLSDWNFTIIDANGEPIQRGSTDSSGIIVFTGLRPGIYTVREDLRNGWREIGSKQVEVTPGMKSSPLVIPNTPNTLQITKIDSEGSPLSGWVFKAEGQNGTITMDPTDKSGVTILKGLPSGTYHIQEEPKDGWRLISIEPNSVTFGSGENKSVRVTNARTGSLRITKRDSMGQPLSGWRFSIEGPDRIITNTTDDSGIVIVKDLMPGKYIVKEIIQEDLQNQWRPRTESQSVTVMAGEIATVQFINDQLLNLRIIKFDDESKNGLPGWMFTVIGPKYVKIVGPTDSQGIVVVSNLIPGDYVVTEEISQDSKPGWICTTQNPQSVKVLPGLPNKVEFGNRVNSLIFKKFNDTNLNRKQDGAEEGLPGWSFNMEGPDHRTIPTDPTNIEGITTAKGLMPGRYIVREVLQNGWINTTPLAVSVDIKAGEDVVVPPFGNVKSSRVEIFKFNDTNRNGIYDSGESGLPGWIFTVKCPNGSVFTARPTNGDGITALERLTPGAYIVTETTVEGWLSTTPTIRIVNLSIGVSNRLSFGNYYCLRCHRINDELKIPTSTDAEITVIKDVSNISAEKIDRYNGYVVDYNITLCPSRALGDIAAIPTDIVIAVDNSPSINNLSESAIEGVQKLAGDIAANDKKHVTRIGLVSWSDEKNSRIEVPLIDNYTEVAARGAKIKFAEGEYTNYSTGLDTALKAFDDAGIVGGKEKKIVFITDASDSGYIKPANIADTRLSGYTIFAIVVGDMKDTKASRMLNNLAKNHSGYVIQLKDLSALGEALVKTATAGSKMKNVHLVEVLPNYLALLNSTATDDQGKVRLNGDSKDWTTTTITWDIGDLSGCWSTDFQAVFCWKLPADVNQPKLASYVNYTDEKGMSRTLTLPEHEINIVPTLGQTSLPVPAKPAEKETSGFEALFAAIGISLAGYLCRRRVH
ncbi:MAG: SpaA isopeptide-forming pilin-related protein [Methanothrix sp.]